MTRDVLHLDTVNLGAQHSGRPVVLLGPSLGTSVTALWQPCANLLSEHVDVVGWELPGHGVGTPVHDAFTVDGLADAVADVIADLRISHGHVPVHYAGDSVGGAVGLALALRHPHLLTAMTLCCTGARIGTEQGWRDRAATVRSAGVGAVVDGSLDRWFGPGFRDRQPAAVGALTDALRACDAESYARVCEALAAFDVLDVVHRIVTPLRLIAGREDAATPVDGMSLIADRVVGASLSVLDGVGHLAPIETAVVVAENITAGVDGDRSTSVADTHARGMSVRRQVAGEDWVDRAVESTTSFTADFQDFITRYAWGTVWTRPGLDRRSRSMITITALVARGHHHELAMHIRAALTNGLSRIEIREVLMNTAIYCGVPDANSAFRVAQSVFDDLDGSSTQ